MRVALLALCLVPGLALAQPSGPAPASAAQPAAAPEKKAAAEPAKAPAAPAKKPEDDLVLAAERFYDAVLAKDVDGVAAYCKPPFFFQGKLSGTEAEIHKKWESALQTEPLEHVKLVGVEYLSFDEMVAKYGKPPEKLSGWPMKGGTISVGNLSGHPAIVLWRKTPQGWQAAGFHD
jgi:hypothetical protein